MPAMTVIVGMITLMGSGTALAQDLSRTTVPQMNTSGPGQAAAAGADQVTPETASRFDVGSPRPGDRRVGGSAAPRTGPVPYLQLNRDAATADVGPQLSTEPGGAGPPPSPGVLAQGRIISVTTPVGPDRCDPQAGRVLPEGCERVIEARAREFPAPDPQPLSAEQRLLATQREWRSMSLDVGTATRRLANGQVDDSTAALAVASMALGNRGPTRDEDEEPTSDTSALDAIVAGITTLVTGAPPNP